MTPDGTETPRLPNELKIIFFRTFRDINVFFSRQLPSVQVFFRITFYFRSDSMSDFPASYFSIYQVASNEDIHSAPTPYSLSATPWLVKHPLKVIWFLSYNHSGRFLWSIRSQWWAKCDSACFFTTCTQKMCVYFALQIFNNVTDSSNHRN